MALSLPVINAVDAGHGHNYWAFNINGGIGYENIQGSYDLDLFMYLAGNQFMVMEELIKDFQSKHKNIKTVHVERIPPRQILK